MLSHFESKRRIETLEWQQKTFGREVIALLRHEIDRMSFLRRVEHGRHLRTNIMLRKQHENAAKLEKHWEGNGRSDYALANAGARVLSIGSTKTASSSSVGIEIVKYLFGFVDTIGTKNSANKLIQPSMQPGECFAFIGRGEVTIKLVREIRIESISVEHIIAKMSPDQNISNAPKELVVFGLDDEHDSMPEFLGRFHYETRDEQPLQEFLIDKSRRGNAFGIVRVQFLTNHGHPDNTCVYRIRIHGTIDAGEK